MTEEQEQEVIATFDMDNPPEQVHNWVDRGMVLSCENAGHANHRHFKRLGNK